MMRRVRLEKLWRTKNCNAPCSSRRARPAAGGGTPSSGRSASTLVLKLFGVLLSTLRLPGWRPHKARLHESHSAGSVRSKCCDALSSAGSLAAASHLLEAITDAIERLDHVEVIIGLFKFLAQALDMAVDGTVVDIDLIVVSRIHESVAAFHHTGAARQRLQDQEFGDGKRDRLVLPGAGVALRVHTQQSAFQHLGGISFLRRGA